MSDVLIDTTETTQTIRGTITQIRYHENGRLVAKIAVDAASRKAEDGTRRASTMSVLGSMAEPMVGQLYEFSGKLEFDSAWCSWQIKFDSYRTILPSDRDGIASYLIDTARWVGPSHAKALLDAFGDQTLEILKHEPDRVTALGISGLSADRVQEMSASLQKNERIEAATLDVNNLLGGVLGPATVRKAIAKWGCDAASVIRENPFELMALRGVGWHSADAVHRKLQGEPTSVQRHAACLVHILSEAAGKEGHTLLPVHRVQLDGHKLLGTNGIRQETWDLCEATGTACSDGLSVSLAELSAAEKYVANKVVSMLGQSRSPGLFPRVDTAGLAADQAAAVAALDAQIACLVGAPGTGKTYTIARIVKALNAAGLVVGLAAPTGKAAKQMSLALSSVCPQESKTIHSLLEAGVNEETGEFQFLRDEAAPLEFDVLVLDELSMVDVRLMRSVLRAVRESTRVLLVGDHYQLPSVGPGAVLRDLLRAGVPSFELKEIKRNAGDIVRACHAIKDGQDPRPFACKKLDLENGHNWRHLPCGGPGEIKALIESLIKTAIPKMDGTISLLWGVQTISPTNEKGELSCDKLNQLIKQILNPAAKVEGKLPFAVGDKVVRLKNQLVRKYYGPLNAEKIEGEEEDSDDVRDFGDHKVRVVNGDIGIVREIDDKDVVVDFRYPARRVSIKRSEHELRMAYAMTCHKLQGSECEIVILPLHKSLSNIPICTREWVYTAMSRAKRILITVGDLDAIMPMVSRVRTNERQTTLAGLIGQMKGNNHGSAT